jgi:hypothetical protein
MKPETKYARSGDVNIAYQVIGKGPRDLVYVPGFVSNLENYWDEPRSAHFLERLASFSRLIWFDKRGTGLSDRYGSFARVAWAADYPWGRTRDEFEARISAIRNAWGAGTLWASMAPSLAKDEAYRAWCAMVERQGASPAAAEALFRMNYDIDARHVLESWRVPSRPYP